MTPLQHDAAYRPASLWHVLVPLAFLAAGGSTLGRIAVNSREFFQPLESDPAQWLAGAAFLGGILLTTSWPVLRVVGDLAHLLWQRLFRHAWDGALAARLMATAFAFLPLVFLVQATAIPAASWWLGTGFHLQVIKPVITALPGASLGTQPPAATFQTALLFILALFGPALGAGLITARIFSALQNVVEGWARTFIGTYVLVPIDSVTVIRSGGFVGNRIAVTIRREDLDAQTAALLDEMVAEARMFEVVGEAVPGLCDAFHFDVTVQSGRHIAGASWDGFLPPKVAALVTWVLERGKAPGMLQAVK